MAAYGGYLKDYSKMGDTDRQTSGVGWPSSLTTEQSKRLIRGPVSSKCGSYWRLTFETVLPHLRLSSDFQEYMCVCAHPYASPPPPPPAPWRKMYGEMGSVRHYEKEGVAHLNLLEGISSACDLTRPLAICSVNMNYEGFI